jgi:hypothetical protein
MLAREQVLREHLPPDTAIKSFLIYKSDEQRWEVCVQFMRETGGPVILGYDPLEEFPSELMIAQAMLVA